MRPRHLLVLLLLVSSATACDIRRRRPAPTSTAASGASCDGAGAAYGRYLGDQYVRQSGSVRNADLIRKGAAESVVESCKADAWPSKVLTCLSAAKAADGMDTCVAQLPADVQSRMADRVATKLASIAGAQ